MKYLYYIWLVLFTIVSKIIGVVWFWVALPFRAYARNTVYNYVLKNELFIKRLYERKPIELEDRWVLQPLVHPETKGGYIKKRKIPVTFIEYTLVKHLLWGWLDDDAYCDTFSAGHNETYLNGERKLFGFIPMNNWLGRKLLVSRDQCENEEIRGSWFDIGDKRALNPKFNFLGAFIWNVRNSAYNFEYMDHEIKEGDWRYFPLVKVGSLIFGWEHNGYIEIDGKRVKTYTMRFLKNF